MMRGWLALLWLAPACQAGFWGSIIDPLEKPKALYQQRHYASDIESLPPDAMQKLKGEHLRQAYFFLGSSYEQSQQMEKALGVYQLGIKLFPKDINLLSELANLLHRMGLEESAEPLYQRVLKIHPNNKIAHLGLAEIDQNLGLLEESAQHYEKALETMGDNASVWREYAELLLELKDWRTAELSIRKALELSPDSDSAMTLALIQRKSGRLAEAIETLDKLWAREPRRLEIALARALWLLEAKRFPEAEAVVDPILKKDPESALALWIRARVYLRTDRTNPALADLEAASRAGAKTPFVAQAAASLLKLLRADKP
ncbi:MAG: tetratricopeptide repeat protein [Elusimicrobia bacterium]|nr:tetratricopeptide repeat protein [Elusimicrobiota bacterium]